MTAHRSRLTGAIFALTLALWCLSTVSVSAQVPPFKAYGVGLEAGAVVEVFVAGSTAGTATVDADGNWIVDVDGIAGNEITFTLDGAATNETETWSSGGAPADVSAGTALTLAEVVEEPSFLADLNTGINLAVFSGGTIEEAITAAPTAASFWATTDGAMRGYTVGAPAFVNAAFLALWTDGVMPTNTALIILAN